MAEHVFIIAEAGVNHNGDLDLALKLVDIAADVGADAVKFQTFKAETLVRKNARKADYQQKTTGNDESQFAMIQRLELDLEAHQRLNQHCKKRGITFLSSAFDLPSIDLLVQMGIKIFKIPSGEITNLPYLRKIGGLGKQVVLSTGMSDMDEIGAALEILTRAGTPRQQICVLHCNTEYPTPMADVNLRAMQTIAHKHRVRIGYSDHTTGIEIPIAAVALGAELIEKHFTLDRNLPGPDHQASLEPAELSAMVTAIRNIELALGEGNKTPSRSELKNREVARRSIVAATAIRQGECFSAENLTVKRPATGLSPMEWDRLLGRTAQRDYAADEEIDG